MFAPGAMLLLALVFQTVQAEDGDLEAQFKTLQQTVQQQQADLDAQRKQMAEQRELIRQLQAALKGGAVVATTDDTAVSIAQDDQGKPVDSGDELMVQDAAEPEVSDGQKAAMAELTRREIEGTADKSVDSQATLYDPSNSIFDSNFRGAWHLPGTTAAMKIGGYVNLAVVNSLDPLVASDRFIVGSIPPDGVSVPGAREGTQVTASQSRLNLEVREQTSYGQLRAFLEGDFLGSGDTFRLRHAYGQYGRALAGKTLSVFSNLESLPEQVDFEGINGAVLVRQPQLRIFPTLGKDYSLVVSIEDPRTDIQNGTGQQGFGDFVFSVDRVPLGGTHAWNYKAAMIFRDLQGNNVIEGEPIPPDAGPTQSAIGWGVTTSGRASPSILADKDFILWQLTYGEGIGRYLNDLGTVGGGDAVFDPNGELKALPVFAGFLSYQHEWARRFSFMSGWPGLLRSNFNYSWINVRNFDFQEDSSYNSTTYVSANLIYFPTQNARFGIEYLWGQRQNKDGSVGSASQIQLSTRFSF